MNNQYKPYKLKHKGIKKSVRLMDKVNQMVIFENGITWMYTTIIQVRESIHGVRTGKMIAVNTPVVFDKLTNTWELRV